jgi:hypothetical protein
MPFTALDYPILTPEQTSPMAGVISGLLKGAQQAPAMYKSAQEAKYAPQTIQADIFGKEFAPLAAIASSPLAQAMLPEQKDQMLQMIAQLLKQNSNFGGQTGQMGSQSSSSQGGSYNPIVNGAVSNAMAGNGQQQTNGSTNPSLPQNGGSTGSGLAAHTIAPATEQIHPASTVFFDPTTGKQYTQPSSGLIETSQKGLTAIRTALPQLQDIAKKSKEFLSPGSNLSTGASQVGGWLSKVDPTALLGMGEGGKGLVRGAEKSAGIDPEKISRYTDWQNQMDSTAERLIAAYPTLGMSDQTTNLIRSAVHPNPGETTEGFEKRMYSQIDRAVQLADSTQQNMQAIPITDKIQAPNQSQSQKVNPESISNQLKNNNVDLTYSEGKEPPPGYIWMRKGKKTLAVHESKISEAKKREYKEVE